MKSKKRGWKPEALNIRASVTFSKRSYVEYFRIMLNLLHPSSMCFKIDTEPIDINCLSLLFNRCEATTKSFINEAIKLEYIAQVLKGKKYIYFANPYVFRFRGKRMNRAVELLFDKKELINEKPRNRNKRKLY